MKKSKSGLIRLIAVFKLLKASVLIVVGLGILKLTHNNVAGVLDHWIAKLGLDPGNRFVDEALRKVTNLPPKRIKELDRESSRLDPAIPPLKSADVLTATFSAPSVSYFVQRNGLDPQTGLMISEAGSLGNHQHANGVTIELYGMGLPLAPDSGIGTNYFEPDHLQYYAQFPAHNTVVVDGISSYPTMKSHHGFTVNAAFPASGDHQGMRLPVTFTDVSFLEPETTADQRRVTSIVRTSAEDGYYVDIFRSRRRDGHDLKHDYFFHGLGQELVVTGPNGSQLAQSPTEKLTFADEELAAYDYLWDKHRVAPAASYHAAFHLQIPGRQEVRLNVWMAGAQDRQLFTVLAPPAHSLRDIVPEEIAKLPLHTLVLRQIGEAWSHPFISVIEPVSRNHAPSVKAVRLLPVADTPEGAVALRVDGTRGGSQIIFSTTDEKQILRTETAAFQGTYGLISRDDASESIFLGDGYWISSGDLRLDLSGAIGSAFVRRNGELLSIELTQPGKLTLPVQGGAPLLRIGSVSIAGKPTNVDGRRVYAFSLPALPLTEGKLMQP